MRRPSPATAISVAALFIALSGTAYAATGGTFILGKANSATTVSSLTNTAGTALSLSSKAGTPPLAVGSTAQVPNLNSSLLGGRSASSFLGANGTAVNANALRGIPPSGFIQGAGNLRSGTKIIGPADFNTSFVTTPDDAFELIGYCDLPSNGTEMGVFNKSTASADAVWWNMDGVGSAHMSPNFETLVIGQGTAPHVVVVQVTSGTRVMTFTATQEYLAGPDRCEFWGQVLSNQ